MNSVMEVPSNIFWKQLEEIYKVLKVNFAFKSQTKWDYFICLFVCGQMGGISYKDCIMPFLKWNEIQAKQKIFILLQAVLKPGIHPTWNILFLFTITLKYMLLLVYIALNKPHSPITGLTYISNTQPQNTGLAYMRYVITPEYRVSIAMRCNLLWRHNSLHNTRNSRNQINIILWRPLYNMVTKIFLVANNILNIPCNNLKSGCHRSCIIST